MNIHPDLLIVEKLVYQPSGVVFNNLKVEGECAEYGAAEFTIDNRRIKFRVGKITPIKIGQFVTFWKRIDNGPILPYDFNDPMDLFIVSVRAEKSFGHFIFPKTLLCEKGIISSPSKAGKRAIRIYPPWDKTDNSQSKKTQAWQLKYFVDFSEGINVDFKRIRYLLETL